MLPFTDEKRAELAERFGPSGEALLGEYEALRSRYLHGLPLETEELARLHELNVVASTDDYERSLRQAQDAPPNAHSLRLNPKLRAAISQVESYLACGGAERADALLERVRTELDVTDEGHAAWAALRPRVDLALLKWRDRAGGSEPPEHLGQIRDAFLDEDYDRVLALTRKLRANPGPPGGMAHTIGRCWGELGDERAAAAFFDAAYEASGQPNHAFLALDALWRASPKDAVARIAEYEATPGAPREILLRSAAILHQVAIQTEPDEDAALLYERVLRLVEDAGSSAEVLPSLLASAELAAAFSCDHLGQHQQAMRHFDRAVEVLPSDLTFVARGFALLEAGRPIDAARDLRAAIAENVALPWPYLFFAHEALVRERWHEAESLVRQGLTHTPDGSLRGQLLEWAAIAAAQLGDSKPSEVEATFERAAAEDPLSTTIADNGEHYREGMRRPPEPDALARSRPWSLPKPEPRRAMRAVERQLAFG